MALRSPAGCAAGSGGIAGEKSVSGSIPSAGVAIAKERVGRSKTAGAGSVGAGISSGA